MTTLRRSLRPVTNGTLTIAAIAALTISIRAQGSTINACVNPHSGEVKISGGAACPSGTFLLQWNQAGTGGPAGPPGPSGLANILYLDAGMYPNTSVSRAFCPVGTKVAGGGGFSLNGAGLQQNYPISDEQGTIAFGSTAIGWQIAATDFSDVQAFVVCVGP